MEITTLQKLADYINSEEYNQSEVNQVIEVNGWEDLCDSEFDVCANKAQKVTINENGKAEVIWK